MALQSSGAITLSDIQGEFGGSSPIQLSEYYGAASGIPGSGTIQMSDFYGASASEPVAMAASYSVDAPLDVTSIAGIRVNRNGTISQNKNSSYTSLGNWAANRTSTMGDEYEARIINRTGAAFQGGSLTGNTWYALTSNREWFVFADEGEATMSFTLEVRHATDTGNKDTASVTLTAEGEIK